MLQKKTNLALIIMDHFINLINNFYLMQKLILFLIKYLYCIVIFVKDQTY